VGVATLASCVGLRVRTVWVFAALRRFVVFISILCTALCISQSKSSTMSRPFFIGLQTAVHKTQPIGGINIAMTRKNPMAVALGSRGGKATAKKMTPEERKEKMRRAAQARWAKAKKKNQ